MRRFTGDRLVVASHNTGKLHEIGTLLCQCGIRAVPAVALGLAEPAETSDDFAGNARIKAHAAARANGMPALADDSGIGIDALGGAPGVRTADWAETPDGRDFAVAMTRAWQALEDQQVPEPRRAAFVCTLCLAWPDGHDEMAEGRVGGRIVWPMRGLAGFGFDPVFLPDGETETFGEMDPERKNAMSHRADAFRKLADGCFG